MLRHCDGDEDAAAEPPPGGVTGTKPVTRLTARMKSISVRVLTSRTITPTVNQSITPTSR